MSPYANVLGLKQEINLSSARSVTNQIHMFQSVDIKKPSHYAIKRHGIIKKKNVSTNTKTTANQGESCVCVCVRYHDDSECNQQNTQKHCTLFYTVGRSYFYCNTIEWRVYLIANQTDRGLVSTKEIQLDRAKHLIC